MISSFSGEHRFLSNFWPVEIEFEGMIFPSVEHAYVAAKTTDFKQRILILRCSTAGKAKKMGREFKVRPEWEDVKLQVMESLIRKKFKDPELASLLLGTAEQELIEGNTWGDTFWGVCDGEGTNYLGKILMQIREEIKDEYQTKH